MFGFLNVYKPKGMTSHDVIAVLRRITKIKQIGHTGTLDPFAEGVLPVCIGKATKLIEYLKDDKAYIGTVQLGNATTTYDSEGDIIYTSEKSISPDDIENILHQYRGEILQTPPVYSAIKVKGKKLYEYARKGEAVEIQPRKIRINRLDIISLNEQTKELEIYIECSKGTYIRSLANDIGKSLGTYGYLTKLTRVKAGDFLSDKAVKLDDLDTPEKIEYNLINPLEYLNYPVHNLNDNEYKLISHGISIPTKTSAGTVLMVKAENIAAIGTAKDNILKPDKVFI